VCNNKDMALYKSMCVYIYICVCVCVYIYIYLPQAESIRTVWSVHALLAGSAAWDDTPGALNGLFL